MFTLPVSWHWDQCFQVQLELFQMILIQAVARLLTIAKLLKLSLKQQLSELEMDGEEKEDKTK